jgi:type I restriction enzyme R subunit
MSNITENTLEQTTLTWFAELGYQTIHGPEIAPDTLHQERDDYRQVVLTGRLRAALRRINPEIPPNAIEEAVRKVVLPDTPDLMTNNRAFHRLLTDGVDIEIPAANGEGSKHTKVWLLDPDEINNNDWLALNQYTVIESHNGRSRNRRADVVVFVNGIPLAVLELKNPADEKADTRAAFNQLQTYKADIPALFTTNELLVASDGVVARAFSLSAGWDRCMPWRTIDGTEILPKGVMELEVLIRGLFDRRRFLDYILNFNVFEDNGKVIKKSAAYHQYWAVNKALKCTFTACGIQADADRILGRFPEFEEPTFPGLREDGAEYAPRAFGDKRIGVIWHTQGSGKSLSMAFYAGKVIRHPAMGNPTLVVITDRNDLDNQLFGTFAGCKDLLRQTPVQADSRAHLRSLLKVASGGVIFTTIQKFMPDQKGDSYPQLSGRKNIVVIADEAHRSQYAFIDGFARHLHDALPNASFIGFTGTPVELTDRSTPAVFGNYIDTYDILRAVEDGATVPIYYENRLARITLKDEEKPFIDAEFDEITEGEEEQEKQKLRAKWAALEAMVGAEKRIELVSDDMVKHIEQRMEALDGKVMIVCMSRRICVDLYNALRKLRPDWHSDDDKQGRMKIVMSGSASDKLDWQAHIRNKRGREDLAERFKDPADDLKIVIVRDMWLTGFDCPSLHTMYIDKPMSGHNLMQAIARVNRVFSDKPGGLVVDYIGIAEPLKRALANYTASGGQGDPVQNQAQAVTIMLEKFSIVRDILHGLDYQAALTNGAARMKTLQPALDHIFALQDGKKRYLNAVSALSKAFALAVPHEKALAIRDEISFFQEIASYIRKKFQSDNGRTPDEMDAAIKQLVSRAVASTEVVDIFQAVGIDKPDISIMSDQFLEEIKNLPHKNLAFELLKKLLNDEIKARAKNNVVQAKAFSEMLENAVKKYQNRAIESAEVIQELIDLANEIKQARNRGDELGLNDDELAFYDALTDNKSARDVMGDEKLCIIAQELLDKVKQNVSIDWAMRENARAQIRVMVKRILRKYGYPPDMAKKATELVMEQTEVLCNAWV